ncbi:MAG: hypothetical protein ACNS60_09875 [Candidatus Cyclobacteriaceae bacterium M2_1C_046]
MSIFEKLKSLSKDNTSGSSQLLEKLQQIIKEHPKELKEKQALNKLEELEDNWPLFPVISHFVSEIRKAANTNEDLSKIIVSYRSRWSDIEGEIAKKLYQEKELNNKKLLLHSQSGTVIKTLTALKKKHKLNFQIFQTESRPALEGREQAKALAENFKVTLFPEADIPRFMKECDYVITGADVITESHFVNKTGTYLLWLACQQFSKSFIIITDRRKLVEKKTEFYNKAVNKDFPPEEAWKDSPSSITVKNRYFELIPLKNVYVCTD